MDCLILSACTGSKSRSSRIGCEEIDTNSDEVLSSKYPTVPAEDLYTGREHNHVTSAYSQLHQISTVDWYILSAGYGLVNHRKPIVPYECTFRSSKQELVTRADRLDIDPTGLRKQDLIRAIAEAKNIPDDIMRIIERKYDLLFIILGREYLLAATEGLESIPDETVGYAFASERSAEYIGDCRRIPATETERNMLETTDIELRGKMFRTLMSKIETIQMLEEVRKDASSLYDLATNIQKPNTTLDEFS